MANEDQATGVGEREGHAGVRLPGHLCDPPTCRDDVILDEKLRRWAGGGVTERGAGPPRSQVHAQAASS